MNDKQKLELTTKTMNERILTLTRRLNEVYPNWQLKIVCKEEVYRVIINGKPWVNFVEVEKLYYYLEGMLDAYSLERKYTDSRQKLELAIKTLKKVYLKHNLEDPTIGWKELEDILVDMLCELIGDDEFCRLGNEPYEEIN